MYYRVYIFTDVYNFQLSHLIEVVKQNKLPIYTGIWIFSLGEIVPKMSEKLLKNLYLTAVSQANRTGINVILWYKFKGLGQF